MCKRDIMANLAYIDSKLERASELLEMIKDQNEGVAQPMQESEDIPAVLKKCLTAWEAR